MPEDYKKVVFDAYKKKKAGMDLSSNLLEPTPGNLRAECLIVYREKYSPKDHEILRLFFSDGDKEKGYIKSIENSKAQKFKQMSKILKGADVKNPGLKYFELLEWLMDLNLGTSTTYYKRNYERAHEKEDKIETGENEIKSDTPAITINDNRNTDKNYETNFDGKIGVELTENLRKPGDDKTCQNSENEQFNLGVINIQDKAETTQETVADDGINLLEDLKETVKESIIGIKPDNTPVTEEVVVKPEVVHPPDNLTKGPYLSLRLTVILCILLLLIGRFSYFAWSRTIGREIRMPRADEKCMYWVGNHYEPVRCDDRSINAVKIPLNLETLKSFEKINETDTLTKGDVKKKWYAKINGKPEYFTAGGMHPVDTAKRLLPLSNYILAKYVHSQNFLLSPLGWLYYSSLFLLLGLLVFDLFKRKKQKG